MFSSLLNCENCIKVRLTRAKLIFYAKANADESNNGFDFSLKIVCSLRNSKFFRVMGFVDLERW